MTPQRDFPANRLPWERLQKEIKARIDALTQLEARTKERHRLFPLGSPEGTPPQAHDRKAQTGKPHFPQKLIRFLKPESLFFSQPHPQLHSHSLDSQSTNETGARLDSAMFAGQEKRRSPTSLMRSTLCLTFTGQPPGVSARPLRVDESFWGMLDEPSGYVFEKRYEISNLLALGGASRVFRGIDRKGARPVAIKVVCPPWSQVVRQSLEVTRSLSHPGILPTEHFGDVHFGEVGFGKKESTGLYLVMPLLQGISFRALLQVQKQATEALLLVFRRACEGVAHAHSKGVIHRDLKPFNIQVEPDGGTVVLDWDLACPAGQGGKSEEGILGTPLYMAPEQLNDGPLSTPSDVYALGVILYEILTGQNPAGPGGNLSLIAHRIRNETPPPPSFLRKEVPRALDEIVLRCLEKDPAARYPHAAALLEELEGLPSWGEATEV